MSMLPACVVYTRPATGKEVRDVETSPSGDSSGRPAAVPLAANAQCPTTLTP